MPADGAIFDDSVPIPPRFWWLKRILVGFCALLVSLILLRLGWGWYASRVLQAEIDRLVAAGEPMYPEDFDPKHSVPDDENAAKLILKAAESYRLSAEQEQAFFAVFDHDKPITDHLDAIQTIYLDNAEPFGLIRQARDLREYDWGDRLRSPVTHAPILVPFSALRVLCKLLCLRAEVNYVQDKDSEAIESLLDNLALARAMSNQSSLVAQLVAWPVSEMSVSWGERFIIPTAEDARNVDRQLVREMIRELLDTGPLHDGLVRAFELERMAHLDVLHELESGRTTIAGYFGSWGVTPHGAIPNWVWRYGLGPQLRLDTVRVLQQSTNRIDAVRNKAFDDPDLVLEDEVSVTLEDVLRRPFGNEWAFPRSVQFYLRCETKRRLGAVGLAIRLYRADHGRLPSRLDVLVPDYLETLPLDPGPNEARTFGYLQDASSPIVYSVGPNGVDDGGKYELAQGHVSRLSLDTPFFINGDRPMPQPAADESDEVSEDGLEDHGNTDEKEGQDDGAEAKENSPQEGEK